jgi:hypothetical protein
LHSSAAARALERVDVEHLWYRVAQVRRGRRAKRRARAGSFWGGASGAAAAPPLAAIKGIWGRELVRGGSGRAWEARASPGALVSLRLAAGLSASAAGQGEACRAEHGAATRSCRATGTT